MVPLDNWIEIQIKNKGFTEHSDSEARKEIEDSFARSLTGVPQKEISRLKFLWENSSWKNFSRFRWNYKFRYELDKKDSRIKELLSLSEQVRAFKVFNATMFISKNAGASSYDGCHLMFWIAQQRKAEELQIYSQFALIKESLHYLSKNNFFVGSSHLAGVNNLHQEACIHAKKVAILTEDFEKKADWFARSASYAARAECVPEAQSLIDMAVETHILGGDYLTAGDMMYECREKRLVQNLDNDFLRDYFATPEFVEKLPLPERNSKKYKRRQLVTSSMLEKAISLFELGIKNPPLKLPGFYTKKEYAKTCRGRADYWRRQLKKNDSS